MIGQRMSPILEEIEDTLWEFDQTGKKPGYTIEGFRAGVKIFASVLMDRVWNLQQYEKMSIEDRSKMVWKMGEEIRSLVKTYTDIDCHDLY